MNNEKYSSENLTFKKFWVTMPFIARLKLDPSIDSFFWEKYNLFE
mgnify:CR=1 FL=1